MLAAISVQYRVSEKHKADSKISAIVSNMVEQLTLGDVYLRVARNLKIAFLFFIKLHFYVQFDVVGLKILGSFICLWRMLHYAQLKSHALSPSLFFFSTFFL